VIDDDPVWLGAVERGLHAYGFESVATASTLEIAWRNFTGQETVIVTEVVVAHEACFSFVDRVLAQSQDARIVAMSNRAPRPQVFRLRDYGVSAYLEKPFCRQALHDCLERSMRTARQDCLMAIHRNDRSRVNLDGSHSVAVEDVLHWYKEHHRLTNAEVEVLRALVQGARRTEIASDRCISINTVKTQVRAILSKSEAPTVRQLMHDFFFRLSQHSKVGVESSRSV
jgi:DNA-binding NarL/FixJ family response regulator